VGKLDKISATAPLVTGAELPLSTAVAKLLAVAFIFPSVSEIALMYLPLPPTLATSRELIALPIAIFLFDTSVSIAE
jgi:hypothetical protein